MEIVTVLLPFLMELGKMGKDIYDNRNASAEEARARAKEILIRVVQAGLDRHAQLAADDEAIDGQVKKLPEKKT